MFQDKSRSFLALAVHNRLNVDRRSQAQICVWLLAVKRGDQSL